MSLRFIYGRSGTGKTEFCLMDIKEKLYTEKQNKLILLVPEQFTFEAEKSLLKAVKKDVMMRAQVLSFKTLANRIFVEVGGLTHRHMKACGRSILLYKVIEQVKKDIGIFSKASKQIGFIKNISDIITELKSYDISPDRVNDILDHVNNQNLKDKLKDINLIFSNFESELHKNYIDAQDELAIIAEKIKFSDQLKGAEFWIDGFTGFTPKQYLIIEELLKKASRINITLCLDSSFSSKDADIFYTTKVTEEKLLKICEKNNISYDEPVYLNNERPVRFKDNEELCFLEKYMFSYPFKSYNRETKNISITKAANVYSEVEEIARDIIFLVRDKGFRFSEINIATRDLKRYSKLISAVFAEYDIPYFIDQKRDIINNPIIVFIISIFEIYSKKWSYESVFKYLKTGLTNIDKEDIYLLENYVLANGIKGDKWKEAKWEYQIEYNLDKSGISLDNQEFLDRINKIKDNVTQPLLNFYNEISKEITIKKLCTSLYDYLVKIGLETKIQDVISDFKKQGELDIANQYAQVWDIVVDVLDQMVEVVGEDKANIDKFAKMLSIGFGEYKIGLIPPALDQVLVSSVDRMKSHNSKILYLIGVNDGIFPASFSNEGILNDKDRENLKILGVELDRDTKSKIFEEQYLVYSSLTATSKFLKLSYPIADHEGNSLRPSIIISRLKKVFPKIKLISNIIEINTDEENIKYISAPMPTFNKMIKEIEKWRISSNINIIWFNVYKWYKNNELWKERLYYTLRGLNYSNQPKDITGDKIKKLYRDKIYLSVSRLEKYAECPFAYFVQYGLKAKERKIYGFKAPDIGIFMHKVLDEFSNTLEKEEIKWKDIDDEWCDEVISIIIENMLEKFPGYILNSSGKYKYLAQRLKRILLNTVCVIKEQITRSSFEPVLHETAFGEGEEYPPIKIISDMEEEINLIGRIDRIDEYIKDGKKYIRIIDYKSGNKSLDLMEIVYGLELQLVIYLDAIMQRGKILAEDVNPAGIFYFKIDDPIIKKRGIFTEEQIKEEVLKKLRLDGLVLEDKNIIREMDRSIDGNSIIIPAVLNKDGSLGKKTKSITKEQFELLQNHVKNIIKFLFNNMQKGNIEIKPYKLKDKIPCKYCKYSSICQFEKGLKGNDYKVLKPIKKEDIWIRIKEGGQKDGEEYMDKGAE